MLTTHAVENQSTPFEGRNLLSVDPALLEAVQRLAPQALPALLRLGDMLAQPDVLALGALANDNAPELINFDRYGHRIDEVQFHPAWHRLMAMMVEAGVQAPAAGSHSARACAFLLFGQVENGAQCPVTMTYASVAALKLAPALAAVWVPKILSRRYDPRSLPVEQKHGALIGMGMTEKQGGSDVRANTTFAEKVDASPFACAADAADAAYEPADLYRIVGHKWFFSAPQSDAHLILAQTGRESNAGLSCFLVPRFTPDGKRNAIRVMRLKDKVGNRSNASAEVEFDGAYGWLVGARGRGIATILEMGNRTRQDCVLGSASTMRAALTHALHHARGRAAFGRMLADQPLMQNVLADLALESEAATALAMRLAQCEDNSDGEGADPLEAALARVLTPAAKYWVCKRGPAFGAEAMEVLGGNGYVEQAPLARLYREFPVNSIWEGSGNIMCLDVLRALQRTPQALQSLSRELDCARMAGGDPARTVFNAYADRLLTDLAAPVTSNAGDDGIFSEFGARIVAERIVLAVQAALLLRHAPACVADGFVASRLVREVGGAFGRLPFGLDCEAILLRALPAPA